MQAFTVRYSSLICAVIVNSRLVLLFMGAERFLQCRSTLVVQWQYVNRLIASMIVSVEWSLLSTAACVVRLSPF